MTWIIYIPKHIYVLLPTTIRICYIKTVPFEDISDSALATIMDLQAAYMTIIIWRVL